MSLSSPDQSRDWGEKEGLHPTGSPALALQGGDEDEGEDEGTGGNYLQAASLDCNIWNQFVSRGKYLLTASLDRNIWNQVVSRNVVSPETGPV